MARVEIPLIRNLPSLLQEVVFKEYKHSLQSVSAPCIHVIPSSLLTYCVFFEIRIRRQESGKKIPDPLHLEAWSTFRVAFWCYVSPKIEHCRKDKNEYSFKYRGANQEGGGVRSRFSVKNRPYPEIPWKFFDFPDLEFSSTSCRRVLCSRMRTLFRTETID